jgi:hypothetical protein
MRSTGIIPGTFYILNNNIQLLALFMNHMRHISKQLIQLADTLFDIPDLAFALNNQVFLEIYFFLRRKA